MYRQVRDGMHESKLENEHQSCSHGVIKIILNIPRLDYPYAPNIIYVEGDDQYWVWFSQDQEPTP